MQNTRVGKVLGFIFALVVPTIVLAVSSTNYTLPAYEVANGGGSVTSSNFKLEAVTAPLLQVVTGANYSLGVGFAAVTKPTPTTSPTTSSSATPTPTPTTSTTSPAPSVSPSPSETPTPSPTVTESPTVPPTTTVTSTTAPEPLFLASLLAAFSGELAQLRDQFSEVTETVTIPIAAITSGVALVSLPTLAGSFAATMSGGSVLTAAISNFSTMLLIFWNLILEVLGLRKKRLPWGTVFVAGTDAPVELAIIRLTNEQGKLVETRVTDRAGRFGFLADSGSYKLDSIKQAYSMQTVGVISDRFDPIFNGQPIWIKDSNSAISVNIAMRSEVHQRVSFITFIKSLHRPFLVVSFGLGLWNLLIAPSLLTGFIALVSGFILLGEWLALRSRYFGTVRDSRTHKPHPGIVLRLLETEYNRVVATQVTDQYGRYSFLVRPGRYVMKLGTPNWQGPSWLTKEEPFVIESKEGGLIDRNFTITPGATPTPPVVSSHQQLPESPPMSVSTPVSPSASLGSAEPSRSGQSEPSPTPITLPNQTLLEMTHETEESAPPPFTQS